MANGTQKFPQAVNDFGKSNGTDSSFTTTGPSLTRQEFAEECDINTLMARYDAHVIGGPGNLPGEARYVDFTSMPQTLMEFHDMMIAADAAFMTLPAVVRREFDNDPKMFVDFAADPENLDQMRTWGLAPPAEPQEKPVVSTAPASAPPVESAPSPSGGASTHGST